VPGQTRSFTYSTLSRLVSATNPEQTANISYLYDYKGNLHQQTDARATIALYGAYDGLNRASGVTYTAVGTTAATTSVTYQYDQDFRGALSSVTAGGNATSYTHDGFGRILASTQTTAGTSYPAFQYQYSLLDDLTQITYPSGRIVQYSLDTAGRVGGVTGHMAGVSTPYISGLSYNAASAPLTIPFNNGITETHTWNDRLQHTGVSAGTAASPTSLLGLRCRADAVRERQQRQDLAAEHFCRRQLQGEPGVSLRPGKPAVRSGRADHHRLQSELFGFFGGLEPAVQLRCGRESDSVVPGRKCGIAALGGQFNQRGNEPGPRYGMDVRCGGQHHGFAIRSDHHLRRGEPAGSVLLAVGARRRMRGADAVCL
jgi:YD repeat-containing protein